MNTEVYRADLTAIKNLIPHREPSLLIDSVEEIRQWDSAVGVKYLTGDEHFFRGHFPDEPIMPGVLVVEALAQTATVLAAWSLASASHSYRVYLLTADKCKFRRPIEPGATLNLHVKVAARRKRVIGLTGGDTVGQRKVAQAEFKAMCEMFDQGESSK